MSKKVSLDKNSNTEIQEINKKLDFLISEVAQIKSEMNRLQSNNEDRLYKLDSRIHGVCGEVINNLYKLQSSIYNYSSDFRDGNRKISDEVKELQKQTTNSQLVEKFFAYSPLIIIGVTIWFVILILVLN